MPTEGPPSALSCLDSGADVILALCPISTPAVWGAPGVSCPGAAAGLQPGSRQAPRHWNEVGQEWIPGRATADQNLALSPLRASQAPSEGQNRGRDPERPGVGVKAKTAKERGLFNLKRQRPNWGYFSF